jgi:hypothetical protein
MKQITLKKIRDLNPCYDPAKFLPENWTGTVVDILNVKDCPAEDRLWVVLREEFIDAKTLRLFAVWCAREALKLIENPDARSMEACNVAEKYANGLATNGELSAAYSAAYSAASSAAFSAASSAAYSAASSAASYAAFSAASYAASSAADSAAFSAARDTQINQLIQMLL